MGQLATTKISVGGISSVDMAVAVLHRLETVPKVRNVRVSDCTAEIDHDGATEDELIGAVLSAGEFSATIIGKAPSLATGNIKQLRRN